MVQYCKMVDRRLIAVNIMNQNDEDKNVMIKVVLPDSLRHQFKATCVLNKTNMNTVLTKFIEEYVEKNKNQKLD